jgi:hypothetical protein
MIAQLFRWNVDANNSMVSIRVAPDCFTGVINFKRKQNSVLYLGSCARFFFLENLFTLQVDEVVN